VVSGQLAVAAPPPRQVTGFEFLGRVVLPHGLTFADTVVGGLSGIVFDSASQRLWALSDDRGEHGPVRLYRLRLDLTPADPVAPAVVTIEAMVPVTRRDGRPFEARSIDPEGLALLADGFLLSTEGIARAGIAPFIAELGFDGRVRRELPLPERVAPAPGRGVRNNLGFEALTVTAGGRWVLAGLENALVQDGPEATVETGSPARILRLDRRGELRRSELVYPVERLSAAPRGERGHGVNGLVDLLPIADDRLLALEREFVEGVGGSVRLYEVSLAGATDVAGLGSLAGAAFTPVRKGLLVDFADLGIAIENFEGISFGPALPDGRATLLVVSDDNFNPAQEATTFLVFALADEPPTVAGVQGRGHRSPLEGRWVVGLEGVVTAVDRDSRARGAWIESARPDGDVATSEGVFALWEGATALTPGESVRIAGRVEETAFGAALPVTRVRVASLERLKEARALPPPVRLFTELAMPGVVDDDGLERFEPEADAIDRWESLEGMRVELPGGVVVNPTASYGELVLRPDGAAAVPRTAAGGVRLTAAGPSLDRVTLSRRLVGEVPDLDVGARLAGPIVGVVDYGFSSYKVLPLAPLRASPGAFGCGDETQLTGDRRHLTVATFNVENLSAAGDPERFARLGEVVARRLRGPDVLALEEIQDDSGPVKGDGVVTSAATLARLTEAIAAAGGPRYRPVWIDPVTDREGGLPGGNIRVAFLLDPRRVELVLRGAAGPLDATAPAGRGRSLSLSLSPGRVAPASGAFDLSDGEGVRRSLAVELRFAGRSLFVVANHWSSKYDDDRVFGATQPPRTPTAAKRLAQAREIRSFVESLLAADRDARVLVLGDLNDFEFAAPVTALAAPPLENLVLRVSEPERYTYVFEGTSQVLDHVVVSPALAAGAQVDIVHLNADCADPRRTSDHDPVVARLRVAR